MDTRCIPDTVQHRDLTLTYTCLELYMFQASISFFFVLLTPSLPILLFLCSSEVTLLPHLLGLKDDGVRGRHLLCRKRKHFVSSVLFVVEMRVAVIDGGRAFVHRRTAALNKNLPELMK